MEFRGRGVSEVAVIGRACCLPGASSVSALWNLLQAGGCAVSQIPSDRWNQVRFGHPRRGEPGRSYTWAAGVLDDIWGFDAAAFGISPREAEQMDPQQRLLLELVREALDDGGIPASSLAGKDVGVFVGASALDHGNSKLFDIAVSDAYFATGNTLSLLSNRISYVYDLRGPSLTVDTACSSSLLALHQAMSAIKNGQIKTAIVAGVNILASPFSFIGFSRASMLSPTGLCHAFDDKADGYVRAEGGVVLVLRALPEALAARNELHGLVLASGSNSDGRTVGVALPSAAAQAALLARIYGDNQLEPEDLAFVEAHGTGTRVGDPAEARAMGESLGRKRSRSLPIGSIKTNIGHLEPASGLAGVLKSMLALEHNVLPASLHCDHPNRDIPFADLNVSVCTKPLKLLHERDRLAGISSFGFGGTNAHVVIGRAPIHLPDTSEPAAQRERIVLVSAHSDRAVSELASSYAARITEAGDAEIPRIAAAIAHRRDRAPVRAVVLASDRHAIVSALNDIGAGRSSENSQIVRGEAIAAEAKSAFVYSGNGSQWSGMGREAFTHNAQFRDAFREADASFHSLAGWRLQDMLFASDLDQKLALTHVAQPLIFALQYATTQTLASMGWRPDMVLGHSVGEIAAAQASGLLPLDTAVKVVHARSKHQERTRLAGRMAVVFAEEAATRDLLTRHPDVEIAAFNSPGAFTLSGPDAALQALRIDAKARHIKLHPLDLDYPFHSREMDAVREGLLADLADLAPGKETIRFISTVDPEAAPSRLDADYWWRNIRNPVMFSAGIECAADLGARIFVDIGPRPTLLRHIADSIAESGTRIACLGSLDQRLDGDPFPRMLATGLARGAAISSDDFAGSDPGPGVVLPSYPWQRKTFRLSDSSEALAVLNPPSFHPLIGARLTNHSTEWTHDIDAARLPEYGDHEIDGTLLLPGAAFVEMAWAAAREWLQCDAAAIVEMQLLQPLVLATDAAHEIRTVVAPSSGVIEIYSRSRLSAADWTLHAKAKMQQPTGPGATPPRPKRRNAEVFDAETIYAKALDVGLAFGPSFRNAARVLKYSDTRISVELQPQLHATGYGLAPSRLDSCFHGLIVLFGDDVEDSRTAYVPIGFGDCRLEKPGNIAMRADITVKTFDDRKIVADFVLTDESGDIVAVLRDARFQARPHSAPPNSDLRWRQTLVPIPALTTNRSAFQPVAMADIVEGTIGGPAATPSLASDSALLEGWATTFAYDLASSLAHNSGIDIDALVTTGRLARHAAPWFSSLMQLLTQSGLAQRSERGFELNASDDLPPPLAVLDAFARDYPQHSAELLAASQLTQYVATTRTSGNTLFETGVLASSTIDALRDHSINAKRTAAALAALLRNVLDQAPPHAVPRILLLGSGPALADVRRLAAQSNATLTLLEPIAKYREKARLGRATDIACHVASSFVELDGSTFDLVLSAGGLTGFPEVSDTLQPLQHLLAPGGFLLAVEPVPSLFAHLASGPSSASPAEHGSSVAPVSKDAHGWTSALSIFSEHHCGHLAIDGDSVQVLMGRDNAESIAHVAIDHRKIVIAAHDNVPGDVLSQLQSTLGAQGHAVSIASLTDSAAREPCDGFLYLEWPTDAEPVTRLTQRVLRLKTLIEMRAGQRGTVSVVTHGAFCRDGEESLITEAGIWTFLRTAANEYPDLILRKVDLPSTLAADACARLLTQAILSGTAETELVLDSDLTRAVRITNATPAAAQDTTFSSARLIREAGGGGLDRLVWAPAPRGEPAPLDVEIEVRATGLNFRDLMSVMSLLPDSILEHGFAGPTLGLECAGVVTRTGNGVKGLAPGDKVIAFARNGFANHVIAPSLAVRKMPDGLSFEAAASLPVVFATAYYGLITLAGIRRHEWVLIHGGAGGVGLAALQVAKSRGARVIASAGSVAKRDLLLSLGADHVVDSRSLSFADDVRRIVPDGVHVVLNSLAGEAMERSIMLLRPFGRFIELGKRDYIADTHIGLAPFKRNLTYHGVDLDQLVAHDPKLFGRLLDSIVKGFKDGRFYPVPHRLFASAEASEAFRAMQQSAHVGKLLLAPPEIRPASPTPRKAFVSEGSHLVTGGLGGFGLKTALWLAKLGVRHLVLAGRSAPSHEARAVLAELSSMGVSVKVAQCDVADEAAMAALLTDIRATMPPLRGVFHAAMVLEDGTLAMLEADALTRVLRPKLAGAGVLDRLTRADDLSYFVLFSSIATVVGNPGQSAYVAANGCLEGLARERRRQGLAASAVCWGALEDVGILAGNETLRASLADRLGIRFLTSDEALAELRDVLEDGSDDVSAAVVAIAPMEWAIARKQLGVLRSPTFATVTHGGETTNANETDVINLREIIATAGREPALAAARTTVVDVISRVLRLPVAEIDMHRPLAEMGIDSLMAIELAMMIENRLGQQIQLTASVGAISITRLVSQIVDQSSQSGHVADVHHTGAAMLARHFESADAATVSVLTDAVTKTDTAAREDDPLASGSVS